MSKLTGILESQLREEGVEGNRKGNWNVTLPGKILLMKFFLICLTYPDTLEISEIVKQSFSQDLIYAIANGRVKTPKSILYP